MAFSFSSFALSRASYSSLDGIFSVTRFRPEVKESISSFSFPLTEVALLLKADGTRGTDGRGGARDAAALVGPRPFLTGSSFVGAVEGALLRLLDAGGGMSGPRLTLRSRIEETLEAALMRRDVDRAGSGGSEGASLKSAMVCRRLDRDSARREALSSSEPGSA